MSILVDKHTKVMVQGITGREGSFHADQCLAYGTKVVCGVTPGKGGIRWKGETSGKEAPVFDTVEEAYNATRADTALIFVPPAAAADAIMEATNAGLSLIICITEGIPIVDMVRVKQ